MSAVNLWNGSPLMVDYTPSSALVAGDVVIDNGLALIAHEDVEASKLGAMAYPGGQAVYEGNVEGSETFAIGDKVYWNDTNNTLTSTVASNVQIGVAAEVIVAADTRMKFIHDLTP